VRLVDTNVLFGLLVRQAQWHDSARALHALDPEWRTESYALVELGNVLARYVRAKQLTASVALGLMGAADARMRRGLITVANVDALEAAIRYRVSAYDARYLVAAERLGRRLVTEDARLRAAAPDLTCSTAEALG
jgi:predicted nucleic acid-binding protein